MGELLLNRYPGSIQPNMKRLTGVIEITAAGAILNQTGNRNSGVTFVKNAAAGRYDGTIHRGYKRCFGGNAQVMMPTAGTVPTVADGNDAFIQGITSAMMLGTSPVSTFTIQCVRSDTDAAANPTSGAFVSWDLDVSDSP
jgi:hypothetical protein